MALLSGLQRVLAAKMLDLSGLRQIQSNLTALKREHPLRDSARFHLVTQISEAHTEVFDVIRNLLDNLEDSVTLHGSDTGSPAVFPRIISKVLVFISDSPIQPSSRICMAGLVPH
jgi:hypothetical protein